MTIDLELTLNRFGFWRVARNKIQIACFRIAWWRVSGKHSIGFEVNWATPTGRETERQAAAALRRLKET